jgi:hypothetical protein
VSIFVFDIFTNLVMLFFVMNCILSLRLRFKIVFVGLNLLGKFEDIFSSLIVGRVCGCV